MNQPVKPFALCLENSGNEGSLIVGNVYRIVLRTPGLRPVQHEPAPTGKSDHELSKAPDVSCPTLLDMTGWQETVYQRRRPAHLN